MRTFTDPGPFSELRVSTPAEMWAAIFLRELWDLAIVADVPRSVPRPSFAGQSSVPTLQQVRAVEQSLNLVAELEQSGTGEHAAEVLGAIARCGQVNAWREWRNALKLRVQQAGQSLGGSPAWVCRKELAALNPSVANVVVLPVAGTFAEVRGGTMYVALGVFLDLALFRASLDALQ